MSETTAGGFGDERLILLVGWEPAYLALMASGIRSLQTASDSSRPLSGSALYAPALRFYDRQIQQLERRFFAGNAPRVSMDLRNWRCKDSIASVVETTLRNSARIATNRITG